MAITGTIQVQVTVPVGTYPAVTETYSITNTAAVGLVQTVYFANTTIVDLKTLLPFSTYPTGVEHIYFIPLGGYNVYLGGTSSANTTILDGTQKRLGPFSLVVGSQQLFVGISVGANFMTCVLI